MQYSKLRKGVRSTPRKARSRGINFIKRIITNVIRMFTLCVIWLLTLRGRRRLPYRCSPKHQLIYILILFYNHTFRQASTGRW